MATIQDRPAKTRIVISNNHINIDGITYARRECRAMAGTACAECGTEIPAVEWEAMFTSKPMFLCNDCATEVFAEKESKLIKRLQYCTEGDRITIAFINMMGMPIARQVTIKSVEVQERFISLVYKEKGKRKWVYTKFSNSFAAFDGWVQVDGVFNSEGAGDWISFDNQGFEQIVDGAKANGAKCIYCWIEK